MTHPKATSYRGAFSGCFPPSKWASTAQRSSRFFSPKRLELMGNWSDACIEDISSSQLLRFPSYEVAILATGVTFAKLRFFFAFFSHRDTRKKKKMTKQNVYFCPCPGHNSAPGRKWQVCLEWQPRSLGASTSKRIRCPLHKGATDSSPTPIRLDQRSASSAPLGPALRKIYIYIISKKLSCEET